MTDLVRCIVTRRRPALFPGRHFEDVIRFLCFVLLILPAAPAQPRRVVAIAHRGEHLHHPENTMPAFEEAVRLGADYIEVDVRTTADGKLVLSHDGSVDRCTNGKGEVAKMTFVELRALDAGIKMGPEFAGTKIPTFDEVLDYARGKINIYVDVKQVRPKTWSSTSWVMAWRTMS